MSRRRRGLIIIAALTIVLVLGALASALMVVHGTTFRAQTTGRAEAQAALAAHGALEVVRQEGVAAQAHAGEVTFADGVVVFSTEEARGGRRVTLEARFRARGDIAVRRRFEAVLEETGEGAKVVSWEEVFGPPGPPSQADWPSSVDGDEPSE